MIQAWRSHTIPGHNLLSMQTCVAVSSAERHLLDSFSCTFCNGFYVDCVVYYVIDAVSSIMVNAGGSRSGRSGCSVPLRCKKLTGSSRQGKRPPRMRKRRSLSLTTSTALSVTSHSGARRRLRTMKGEAVYATDVCNTNDILIQDLETSGNMA